MINKGTNLFFAASIFFLFILNILSAQEVSPFNKLSISDSSGDYSFIVSGHFHGESTNLSTFPAATILAGVDTLNSLNPRFLISLGDLFLDVNDTYINNYQKCLFNKLRMPIFNSVGNHDLSNNNRYEKVYGKTFFSFLHNTELFVILNTEINDGSIKNEQLDFLKDVIKKAVSGNIKNVFIFSHRPVWSENDSTYKLLFQGNTRTAFGKNNFESEIAPLLKSLPKSLSVFWMSGSLASGPASFFYHKEPTSSLTFIQTAIRDLPRDAVLQVFVKNGGISFKGISLTGQDLQPIESYDLKYWNEHVGETVPFNYRLLPLLTLNMLKHYYFWIGFVSSLVLFFSLRWVYKKWKRKK